MNEQTILQKELGTNSFVTNDNTDRLERNSADISNIYRRTESGLRDNWKTLVDARDPRADKVEKDLKDFYSSISKKYNVPINSRNDFLSFLETLSVSTDMIKDAKDQAEKANENLFAKSVASTEKKDRDNFIEQIEQSFSNPYQNNLKNIQNMTDKIRDKTGEVVRNSLSSPQIDKFERKGLKDKFEKAKLDAKENTKSLIDQSVVTNSDEIIKKDKLQGANSTKLVNDKDELDDPQVEF